MLCQTCQTSIQRALDVVVKIPKYKVDSFASLESNVLHRTPHSLYRSIITGCYICRKTWMSFLEDKPVYADSYQLQRAFEGEIPETYEEFCKQMKLGLKQSCTSHPPPSSIHNPSNGFADKVQCKTPYIVFDVDVHLGTVDIIQLCVKGAITLQFKSQPVSKTILENQFPIRVPEKVQSLSTDGNSDLWRYWLHTCTTSHTKCRALERKQEPFVPDRLIQILEDDEGNDTKWRLVEKCRGEINTSTLYLALSHCWGSHEHLKLTKEEHSVFREASNTSSLSRTYQDAFRIATALGFHFIWIDSLCIVQDEIDDWIHQSSMMGTIYGGARCNIAATWATDGTDGCFSLRDPYMIDPTTIKLRLGDQFVDWDIDYYLSYYWDVDQAPLNKRAWVTQERYLARKQLNFSKRQVYWECLELTASEQYPNGCPKTARIERKPSMEVRHEDDFMYIWEVLRDNYSNATLSRKSDKLIALAGIASELRKSTEDEYIAGLWKKKLHEHLCWVHSFTTSGTNRSRISADIAPTWSWASLDGPVNENYSFSSQYTVPLFQLTDFSASTCDTSQPTKLVLKGLGAWARVKMKVSRSTGWDFHRHRTQITDQPELMESYMMLGDTVDISWDENVVARDVNPERWDELRGQREGVLLFMWVACVHIRHGKIFQGLVLRMLQEPTKGNLFVRMGVFVDYSQNLGKSYKHTIHRKATGYDENDNDGDEGDEENMLWDFSIDLDDPRLASLLHTVTIV